MNIYMIPYNGKCKIPGAELGPIEIAKSMYWEKKGCYKFVGILDFDDTGEIKKISERIQCELRTNKSVVILGGDHSTTSYISENILDKETKFSYIIFDAHNDYSECEKNSIYNWNVINVIEKYMQEGIVIGYRDVRDSMPQNRKFTYYMDYASQDGIKEKLIDTCQQNEYIYLSIDVDAINPMEFPGTGYKCSGGIFVREIIEYISLIKKHAKFLVVDIVEFNPLIEKEISLLVLSRIIKNLSDNN